MASSARTRCVELAPRARLDVPAGVEGGLRYVIEGLPAQVRDLLFAGTLSAAATPRSSVSLLAAETRPSPGPCRRPRPVGS